MTPPDTNGRLVGSINAFGTPPINGRFPTEMASPSGESFVYMTYVSPLLSPGGGSGVADVYQAERTEAGWITSRRIGPSGSEATQPIPGGVSSDHLYATTNVGNSSSSMALGGETDYLANPDGTYELVGQGSLGSEPFAQTRWISDGGQHVIFATGKSSPQNSQSVWCFNAGSVCKVQQLEPNAPPTGTGAIYDRGADGPTRVVSLLPGDVTPAAGEGAFYKGVARDGTAVAFTIGGTLYVRVDNAETLEVASGDPTFAGLSADGRYLFYVAAGNVHRFDTEDGGDEQLNSSGNGEIVNVSADGSHVYFVSASQLDGTKGAPGQPNLYVWRGAAIEYVATVSPSDIPALTNWTSQIVQRPGLVPSRTTPDGSVLVFESRAQLTSYDNAGHVAIYRYDDSDKDLACVSCNPTAEPATGDTRLQETEFVPPAIVINNLSADGSRVFFESSEALVSEDKSPVNDIYQWHLEEGGSIVLGLISSGESVDYSTGGTLTVQPRPNTLLSVTPDGKNVVFLAQDVLTLGAPQNGTQAIYNARINGGFPPPPVLPVCTEEGCRAAPGSPPSPFAIPQSETILGSGNVKPRKRKPHCRRAKHRKHKHCRKKKASRRQRARAGASAAAVKEGRPSGGQAPQSSGTETLTDHAEADIAAAASFVATAGPFDEYGIKEADAELSTPAAGMHPDVRADVTLNYEIDEKSGRPTSNALTEEVAVALPPGLLGNPRAIPRCSMGAFLNFNCPVESQIGIAALTTVLLGNVVREPIYNLTPPHPDKEVARFGFVGVAYPVFVDVEVRSAEDFKVVATGRSAPALTGIVATKTTIWGNPSDPIHDKNRLTPGEALVCPGTACEAPGGKRASTLPPTAFLSNPSACQPMAVGFAVKSYQLPGQAFTASAPMKPTGTTTDCAGLPFDPSFVAQPTSRVAGAPTGLSTTLTLPQQSTEAVNSPSTATMREARVTLPEGMTIAAGAADSLAACSEEQVGYGKEVNAACPDAAKLGTAKITSPYLDTPLEGEVFQRTPQAGRLFGLWLVSDDLGLHVKIPGEIVPNKATGQLTAAFADLPQVPVEEIQLNVWGGPRAPLKNPEACGTYTTAYTFAPHSQGDPAVSGQNQMTIDQGCGATDSFTPALHAGATNPVAGAFSPFVLDVEKPDRQQNLGALEVTLPQGELAKLAGVPLCPDGLAATGACPVNSKIGSVTAAVGPGPSPLWIPQPGKSPTAVYLAGPYKGAPFSVVTAVPAQAGPFDLGVVTVRAALQVDPETAQATVVSDPLPQFIEGVAATYRRLHVAIDRPGFSLNPTDCSELAVTSKITSVGGAVATPSSRFQVDGCKALGFKPTLTLRLKGGTKRAEYPALTAVVKARKGDANIGRVSVALPPSEFLAQEHLVTICTRKQFAVDDCPKGSVYGTAKAWTPLLDKPLQGPVYLRSSDNPLPDLVMALGGELDVHLVGRIDSKNRGIRTTFDSVPDAPITKFVLRMRGGKKSLLVNSTDICRGSHRATVRMRAQNGRRLDSRPVLQSSSCGGGKKKK